MMNLLIAYNEMELLIDFLYFYKRVSRYVNKSSTYE